MTKLFYSYQDGGIYWVDKNCDLKTLMEEHIGGDGLLIFASKTEFEIVEYLNFEVSGFTTKITPNMNRSDVVKDSEIHDHLFEFLHKSINEFQNEYERLKAVSW